MSISDPNSDGIFDLLVEGRHLDGPHDALGDMDIDSGSTFSIFIRNINALGNENKSLGFSIVEHLHFPGHHSDFVEIFGRRVGDDFNFIVTGSTSRHSHPETGHLASARHRTGRSRDQDAEETQESGCDAFPARVEAAPRLEVGNTFSVLNFARYS